MATHLEPAKGYGGVAVSATRLARYFGQAAEPDGAVFLCASDGSLGTPIKAEDVNAGKAVSVRLYRTYWFKRWGFGFGAIPALWNTCSSVGSVYICGISTWPTTLAAVICRGLRRPYVISPRGGLMPEHVQHIRRERILKWWFYKLFTIPSLRHASAIHCTSELEAEGVRALVAGKNTVAVIPNSVEIDPEYKIPSRVRGPKEGLTICYIGRLSPEKGINAFTKTWLASREKNDRLLIAGDGEPGAYLDDFQLLLKQGQGAIEYLGYINRDVVLDVIARSHFLVLPSGLDGDVRENFGNVVAEALSLGCPALVTKGLSWDQLDSEHAGLCFHRDAQSVQDVLVQARSITDEHWKKMSIAARAYAMSRLDASVISGKVWQLLEDCGKW